MSEATTSTTPAVSAPAQCRIQVCRDCCCGTARKHPDVDHEGQLRRLTEETAGFAIVQPTGCLLACERSNVVVVNPSPQGRARGGRPTWFMTILTDSAVADVVDFVRAGGPGVAEMGDTLSLHVTSPGLLPTPTTQALG